MQILSIILYISTNTSQQAKSIQKILDELIKKLISREFWQTLNMSYSKFKHYNIFTECKYKCKYKYKIFNL